MRALQQFQLVQLVSDKWSPEDLAGHCIAVNMIALDAAREIFDGDVEVAIGRVYVDGQEVFSFEPHAIRFHDNDDAPRVNIHCWLACPTDGYLIDLTLVPTLRDKQGFDASFIPAETVFLNSDAANAMNIRHEVVLNGQEAEDFINQYFRG